MSDQKEYLSCAETAKLVRKSLKAEFPGQKFSVRSSVYSGGASIDVEWSDGPTTKKVEKILWQFEGRGFDGMIDMAYSISHWMLPDGTIQIAKSQGTEDSRGMYPKVENARPHPEAKLVHFGANYVSPNRRYTREALTGIAEAAVKELEQWADAHIPEFEISGDSYGAYITSKDWQPVVPGGQDNIRDWIMRQAEETDFTARSNSKAAEAKIDEKEAKAPFPETGEAIDEAVELAEVEPETTKTCESETPMDKMVKYLLGSKSPGDVLNILTNSGAVDVKEGMALIARYV